MRLGGVPPAIPDLYGPGAYQGDVSPLLWLQPRLGRLVSRGGQLVAARGVRALRHREDGGSPHRAPPSLGSRSSHIPSDLVVDHWTSDSVSSSHRHVLLFHDVWITSNRL